jgi:DNA-binding CsgD family transcriptional regulator
MAVAALGGQAGTLLVSGEAGTGKTTLLEWAGEHWPEFQRITVTGSASETHLACAGLFDLVRPLMSLLDGLPDGHARALRCALGFTAPEPVDPLAIHGAVLSLVSAAAESIPCMVLVDDVGWLDSASREAIAFMVRRLDRERVICLVAGRPEGFQAFPDRTMRIDLGGLAPEAARVVLERSAGRALASHVVDGIVRESGGNPLVLTVLPELLSTDELNGLAPLRNLIPPDSHLERLFAGRIAGLSTDAAQGVLLAVLGEGDGLSAVIAAGGRMGLQGTWIDEARHAGVLRSRHEDLLLAHPLMRGPVLRTVPATQVREAHGQLARSTVDLGRRAWHRAASIEMQDHAVAAELAAVAADVATRGSPDLASDWFERAAELTPSADARAVWLMSAAQSASIANHLPRAHQLLDRIELEVEEPSVRLAARVLRGHLLMFDGHSAAVASQLERDALAVPASDPVGRAWLLAHGALADTIAWDLELAEGRVIRATETLEAAALPIPSGVSVARAFVAALLGDHLTARRVMDAWPGAFDLSATPDAVVELWTATLCHAFVGDLCMALVRADHCVQHLRERRAYGLLTPPLILRSFIHFRLGDHLRAYADAAEADGLSHGGPRAARAFVLTALGRAEAGLGRFREAHDDLSQSIDLCRQLHLVGAEAVALAALGLMQLGDTTTTDAALRTLQRADTLARSHRVAPMVLGISRDLMEAAMAVDRPEIAADHLSWLQGWTCQTPWMRATASWASARLGVIGDQEEHLRVAVDLYREAMAPFDEARTLIDLAALLRRLRRNREASITLADAIEILDRAGAAPWSEAAQRALTSPQQTLSAVRPDLASLSPAELRVAVAAAHGASTKEVAAHLFLSPRTVEHHLSSIYAKLGLRSRAALAWFISGNARDDQSSPERPPRR